MFCFIHCTKNNTKESVITVLILFSNNSPNDKRIGCQLWDVLFLVQKRHCVFILKPHFYLNLNHDVSDVLTLL